MKTLIPTMCVAVLGAGCAQRTYVIDFSEVQGFEWGGRLQVVKSQSFLSNQWRVERVLLPSRDGRVASVEMNAYLEAPLASIDLSGMGGVQVLGVRGVWGGERMVLIMEPEAAKRLAEAERAAPHRPAPASQPAEPPFRPIPTQLQPYREHVDELNLADWWAIATQSASDVRLEYRLPDEKLRIVMQGDPRAYGPATLEVQTEDGQVLRRFEQQQIGVTLTSQPADE